MAAGDVYRFVAQGQQSGNEWVNALHFRELASGPDLAGLAAGVKATLYDALKASCTPQWSFQQITISQLVVGGGPTYVGTYTDVGTNATTAGEGALTNAFCAKLGTTLAGRSHRGRIYLPDDAADAVQGGKWVNAHFTPINAALQALLGVYGSGGTDTFYEWVVWSRKLGETVVGGVVTGYNYAAGAFTIASVRSDPIARVQRRREFGKGA